VRKGGEKKEENRGEAISRSSFGKSVLWHLNVGSEDAFRFSCKGGGKAVVCPRDDETCSKLKDRGEIGGSLRGQGL